MGRIESVELTKNQRLTCELENNKYKYTLIKDGDTPIILGLSDKRPQELTNKSDIGSTIFSYLNEKIYQSRDQKKAQREDYSKIMEQLQSLINEQLIQQKNNEQEKEEKLKENYLKLLAHFENRAENKNYTPLKFLSQISQGLGVGLTVEVIKAFFGFYQTYLGLKGTNVIAIGSQSSGKSHIIEQALEMIPQEKVHRGVKTVAHFFRSFNGQNLTGHIFYLGDLGGDNDDPNTIELRDKLKQLSTDGYIERGIVDDSTPHDEVIKGYPCLAYTTANEEMINAQEKSRSMIITPPDVDAERLEIFNFTMDNPGMNKQLIDTILNDKESVKGLVYDSKKTIKNIECFNPYMFNITDYLKDTEDFNRKIKEFNAILKLVCLLNDPFKLEHEYYTDEEYQPIKTTIIIARKQDVLNALHLFDHSNDLLPTEVALANGLLKTFKVFELEHLDSEDKEETRKDFEDFVKEEIPYRDNGDVDWDNLVDIRNNPTEYFFTVSYLRNKFYNSRWYRRNKDELPKKLNKLYQSNILIKTGKSDGENVYGINRGLGKKIDSVSPKFGGKGLKKAKKLFKSSYPDLYNDVEAMIIEDSQLQLKKIDFEIEGSKLYNVPW